MIIKALNMEITEKFKVPNRMGFHLRAAAKFARTCAGFNCSIRVENNRNAANGKSVLNLVSLAAACGEELTVTFTGEDAATALEEVRRLFVTNFGEPE